MSNRPFFISADFIGSMLKVTISLVAILAATIGFVAKSTDTQATQALNQAQQYAFQAMGIKANGEIETGYAWTEAYRQWLAWDSSANLAKQQGYTDTTRFYETVRDKTQELSPLLKPPYFDVKSPNTAPKLPAFEATYLVKATDFQERFTNLMALVDALKLKITTYTNLLVLMVIAMVMLNLAKETHIFVGKDRWIPIVDSRWMWHCLNGLGIGYCHLYGASVPFPPRCYSPICRRGWPDLSGRKREGRRGL